MKQEADPRRNQAYLKEEPFGPEWRALELMCRGLDDDKRQARLRSLLALRTLEWGELVYQAVRHQMLPMLAYQVISLDVGKSLAVNVQDHLNSALDLNRHRTRIHRTEAARIVQALNAEGVPFVATKGITLESTVYKGLGVRVMKDIDFMIAESSRTAVSAIMLDLGYEAGVFQARSGQIEPHPRRDHIRYRLQPDHLPRYVRLNDDSCVRHIYVDFANSLTWEKSPYEIPVEIALEKRTTQPLPDNDGIFLPCFDPCFQFLFTVLHLFREAWLENWMEYQLDVSLMKFGDVIRLFEQHRDTLCSGDFRAILGSHGIAEPVAWVLEHLDRTFETDTAHAVGTITKLEESWLNSAHRGRGGERRWLGSMRARLQSKHRDALFVDAGTPEGSAPAPADLPDIARSIGSNVLASTANSVDAENRFPQESVAALRQAGLLGYFVPTSHGGLGGNVRTYCEIASILGEHCLSTAIIWAMHCQQAAVLSDHGDESHTDCLVQIAREGALLAAVVSEYGKGGDVLRAIAPLRPEGDLIRVSRAAPIVSYGAEANFFLLTMRSAPERPTSDVKLVLIDAKDGGIEVTGDWNSMGLRGSRSVPMRFEVAIPTSRLLTRPFREIAVTSFVPLAHLGWTAAWFGAARGAFIGFVQYLRRTRSAMLRSEAFLRRLAELRVQLDSVDAMLENLACRIDSMRNDSAPLERYEDIRFLLAVNNLKIAGSRQLFSVVDGLVEIAGAGRGYNKDSDLGLERVFRDLRSASLMFSNDRLLDVNGRLVLVESSPIASAWR